MVGIKGLNSADAIIGALIGITVVSALVVGVFPTIADSFVDLSLLGNFTFASMFAAGGVVFIILSVAILIGFLSMLGLKKLRGGR